VLERVLAQWPCRCSLGAVSFDHLDGIDPYRIWDGVTGRVVHGERVTFAQIDLEPNCVVPEHSHENEQVGLLLDGSMTFTIGGESRELGPGATWSIAANVPHSVETGPDGAVVIEVFAPPRIDWQ
jgi:quercetin dioxygenase-like cupin family protein